MHDEGIKPGEVTSEWLEMICPIWTGAPESDDHPVQNRHAEGESLDAVIDPTRGSLHSKVDDEKQDRGNQMARHQARIAQDHGILQSDHAAWNLLRAIVAVFEKNPCISTPIQDRWWANEGAGWPNRKSECSGPGV